MSSAVECILAIKAVPHARQSEVVGWLGDALKIRLKAPPVDGKPNDELCRFLSDILGIPRTAVSLASGCSARQKRVRLTGVTLADILHQFPREAVSRFRHLPPNPDDF